MSDPQGQEKSAEISPARSAYVKPRLTVVPMEQALTGAPSIS